MIKKRLEKIMTKKPYKKITKEEPNYLFDAPYLSWTNMFWIVKETRPDLEGYYLEKEVDKVYPRYMKQRLEDIKCWEKK